MVRLRDRRKRRSRPRQLWRHLRAAMQLLLRRPVVAVSILPVLGDDRIVLVRRVDNDRWGVPGGMVDWGETVEQAARRELEEETGLEITSLERLVGIYSDPQRDPRAHSIAVAVAARVHGEMEIQDPLELSEIHAFPAADLPWGYLAYGAEQQLRDFLGGTTVIR